VCRITTLDGYAASHGVARIDFMKVDVEGHELEVFKGASHTLSAADAPIVAFEINRRCLDDRGIAPQTVSGVLREYGYTHFWAINPFGGTNRVRGEIGEADCDYLAVK